MAMVGDTGGRAFPDRPDRKQKRFKINRPNAEVAQEVAPTIEERIASLEAEVRELKAQLRSAPGMTSELTVKVGGLWRGVRRIKEETK
jgi:hypothetical protein